MKYEYWQGDNKNWFWHLKAGNGEVIAQSEGYTSKQSCLEAIKLVKSSGNAPEVEI